MDTRLKDFLCFCLHEDATPKESFKSIDWQALLDFGIKQSIVGVLFHGISRLKSEDATMPHAMFKKWVAIALSIRSENEIVFKNNANFTGFFYSKYKHRGCTLKGQGNALMYPDPYMRTSGDIDFWVAPNKGETIDDIIRLSRQILPGCELSYHHATLNSFNGTPIELHFRPSFVENKFYNRRLQNYFDEKREEQFNNFASIPDNNGVICVPKDDFNLIFQLSHIQRHFLFEGIGLRQLIDYYYLLRRGFSEEQRHEYVSTLKKTGMLKFSKGLMYVMKEWFGLEDKYILVKPNQRIGKFIMSEVLQTGNFGYGDERFQWSKTKNKLLGAFYSVLKGFRFIVEFPGEVIFGHGIWILWWHFYYGRKMERIANKK